MGREHGNETREGYAVNFLNDLLARLAEIPSEDQPAAIQQTLAENPGLNHQELSAAALEAFESLTEDDAPANDNTLNTLVMLAHVADGTHTMNATTRAS